MKQAVRQLLAMLGYRIEGIRYTPRALLEPARLRPLTFDDVLCRHMFEHGESCSFIQIGAYDGISTDPLHRYIKRCDWHGIMLEPQPGAAQQLRELYTGNDAIMIMEAALDSRRGTRSLFFVDSDQVPKWAGGIASFDRAHILKHDSLIPGIAGMVRETTVDCITFEDVLELLGEQGLDLLQIDAEGADADIIALFPFERIKPAIVHWERKNIDRQRQEETLDLLWSHGYLVAPSGDEDMLAVRKPR